MSFLTLKSFRLTLWVGLVFFVVGLFYLFLVPPFQVPDEFAHFNKSVQLSERFVQRDREVDKSWKSTPGLMLPQKLGEFSVLFSNLPHQRNVKVSKEQKQYLLRNLFRKTNWNKEPSKFFENMITVVYPPVGYLLSSFAIFGSEVLDQSEIIVFYFGRLINHLFALFSILVCFHFSSGVYRLIVLMIAFVPMFIFEAASFSADSIVNSLSLFLVLMAQTLAAPNRISVLKQLFFVLVSSLFSLSKLVYGFFPVTLFFLRPHTKENRFRDLIFFLVVVLASFLPVAFWFQSFGQTTQLDRLHSDVNSAEQLHYVLDQPFNFLVVLFRTLFTKVWFFAHSGIGFFGWLDTPLPNIVIYLYFIFTLFVFVVWRKESPITIRSRLGLLFGFFACYAAFSTAHYLHWTNLKASLIEGVQGRYFIPCFASFLLGIRSLFPKPHLEIRNLRIGLVSIICLHILSLILIYKRYWWAI